MSVGSQRPSLSPSLLFSLVFCFSWHVSRFNRKIKTQLKSWEFLFRVLQKTVSQEGGLSESSRGLYPKGKERTRIRRSSCWGGKNLKKKHVIKHHKILLVTHRKKEQTFQVNDFSAVLFMGRCKSLGSVKLFLFVHPNTVEPVSPFFCILNSLRAQHWGQLQWLMAVGSSIHCLPEWQATALSLHQSPLRVTLSCCGCPSGVPGWSIPRTHAFTS